MLSLVTAVTDAAASLPEWIRRGREFADQIVVCVDAGSEDDTWGVARALADVVVAFEPVPNMEVVINWAFRHADGDWILRLDGDECASRALVRSLPRLVEDRDLTHYYIPRRWVVRRDDGTLAWLSCPPWNPEHSLRLHRNVGSIWRHPGGVHDRVDVDGEGRFLDPSEGELWHLDLAWRDRRYREAKVEGYTAGAPSIDSALVYLWEDRARPSDLVAIPPEELDPGWHPPDLRAPRQGQPDTPLHLPGDVPLRSVLASVLEAAAHRPDPPVFGAEYLGTSAPSRLEAGRSVCVEVAIRNTSAARWRNTGRRRGRVWLGHRWEQASSIVSTGATLLPHAVEIDATVTVLVGLWAPAAPGRYRLVWDLHAEELGDFSAHGAQPHATTIEVIDPG